MPIETCEPEEIYMYACKCGYTVVSSFDQHKICRSCATPCTRRLTYRLESK